MTPAKPTASCPHCGGLGGFLTSIVFKAKRLYAWDGKDVDTEGYEVASETNPRCLDCGKAVRALFKPADPSPSQGTKEQP